MLRGPSACGSLLPVRHAAASKGMITSHFVLSVMLLAVLHAIQVDPQRKERGLVSCDAYHKVVRMESVLVYQKDAEIAYGFLRA